MNFIAYNNINFDFSPNFMLPLLQFITLSIAYYTPYTSTPSFAVLFEIFPTTFSYTPLWCTPNSFKFSQLSHFCHMTSPLQNYFKLFPQLYLPIDGLSTIASPKIRTIIHFLCLYQLIFKHVPRPNAVFFIPYSSTILNKVGAGYHSFPWSKLNLNSLL